MTPRKVNISYALENSTTIFGRKTAIVSGNKTFTYEDVNRMASRIANGLLETGIAKGDKVALSCPNNEYFPAIYFGILKIGAVVVPLNILLKKQEIEYHLRHSDAKILFFHEDREGNISEGWNAYQNVETCERFIAICSDASKIKQGMTWFEDFISDEDRFISAPTSQEDTAVILYTSGTTGRPKGAELTHGNLFDNAMALVGLMQLTSRDVQAVALPLFHSFGQTVQLNAGFFAGCKLVLLSRFSAEETLSVFEREGVTVFAGVPTMYWELLHYPHLEKFDMDRISITMRLGVSGGAAMPVKLMEAFEKRFKMTIQESYGLSETSPVACFSRIDIPRKAGSIGVAVPGSEMIIADENGNPCQIGEIGEILIRGHHIFKGYYKNPEATKEAFQGGWFHSGDLGRMDRQGYFYVVDRKKDMIIRGGYNIYPREIEEVMMRHPRISLVAVVGEKDEKYGEEVVAYVVLKEGKRVSEKEIMEWCKSRIASYKYPRKIIIVESLPKTATGKIKKRDLRKK